MARIMAGTAQRVNVVEGPVRREIGRWITSTEGTAAIDVIDRARNQLVWEAAATARVTDKTRDNLESVVGTAIADMFKRFPVPETAPAQ